MKKISEEYNKFFENVLKKIPEEVKNNTLNKEKMILSEQEKEAKEKEENMKMHYEKLKQHLEQFKHKEDNKFLNFDFFDTEIYEKQQEIAEKIKKGCIKFCEKNQEVVEKINGLIFYSKIRGSGKTLLAKIIANYFLDNYKMAKFTTGHNIISEIMADKENQQNIIYKYQIYTLLVIDELNMIKFSDFKEGVIFDIIEARKQNKKPTIITTNIVPNDLEIGESLKNRLKNYFYLFEFPEISIRDKIKIAEQQELEDILFE